MNILVSLFTALLAAGSFIRIPLGPVAITLQSLFLFMSALLLPPKKAVASVLLYLFLGAIGFPVFTSGGGLAGIMGPTGGFLLAMIPASAIGSYLAWKNRKSTLWKIIALLIANSLLYAFGLVWMAYSLSIGIKAAFITGCLPFLLGDALKIAVAVAASKHLEQDADRILNNEEQ